MKLIIDIPEVPLYRDMYTAICENGYIFDEDNEYIAKAIKNGTPISDNATNGDVMKIIFLKIGVYDEWYDEPYQKGSINRKNCEYRHENGNCLKVGGFCTSVDDEHCVKGGSDEY